jgi:hypothetical protein
MFTASQERVFMRKRRKWNTRESQIILAWVTPQGLFNRNPAYPPFLPFFPFFPFHFFLPWISTGLFR